ncbi:hypothetical protein [Planctomicrobium piriforme]|uniref:Uncharacterized protein n=1 Tax=Planctomicrobium piriforme TaxID=1576369 RepID=A0A1I3LCR3_9PLAN|nr:hypothetical protein [Planctomicrobium piriforme]SFI82592.1 hypothetical protein SAMN05421753_112222 [Planctomicrobium piriforme]
MWCEHCQTDVATEISADGQSLLCTTCGQPARKVVAPSLHPETKSAREFLERWAREQQALKQQRAGDAPAGLPAAPVPAAPATPPVAAEAPIPAAKAPIAPIEESAEEDDAASGPPIPKSKTKWRLDNEHGAPSGPVPTRSDRPRRSQRLEKIAAEAPAPAPIAAEVTATASTEPVAEKVRPQRKIRIDDGHESARGPHFDPMVNAPRKATYPGRAEAMWGQLLAYGGVGLLTVGTVLVLWGYFGEIEQYASTGWLVSTAGQMLLLLGIVTLVGGGMQQTTHEVSQRIEHLGGRMIRIEESTDKILKGPHFRRSRRRSEKRAAKEQDAA